MYRNITFKRNIFLDKYQNISHAACEKVFYKLARMIHIEHITALVERDFNVSSPVELGDCLEKV